MPTTNRLYLQAFRILCHWCKALYNDIVLPDQSYGIVVDLAPMILPSQNEATVILLSILPRLSLTLKQLCIFNNLAET